MDISRPRDAHYLHFMMNVLAPLKIVRVNGNIFPSSADLNCIVGAHVLKTLDCLVWLLSNHPVTFVSGSGIFVFLKNDQCQFNVLCSCLVWSHAHPSTLYIYYQLLYQYHFLKQVHVVSFQFTPGMAQPPPWRAIPQSGSQKIQLEQMHLTGTTSENGHTTVKKMFYENDAIPVTACSCGYGEWTAFIQHWHHLCRPLAQDLIPTIPPTQRQDRTGKKICI